jgi:hypothetical protein
MYRRPRNTSRGWRPVPLFGASAIASLAATRRARRHRNVKMIRRGGSGASVAVCGLYPLLRRSDTGVEVTCCSRNMHSESIKTETGDEALRWLNRQDHMGFEPDP